LPLFKRRMERPDMSGEVVKAVYYEVKNFQHFKHVLRSSTYSFSSAKYYELLKELNDEFLSILRVEASIY